MTYYERGRIVLAEWWADWPDASLYNLWHWLLCWASADHDPL